MRMKSRQESGPSRPPHDADTTADRLHSVAIHLLRRLRRADDASGLGAPRLSALSVVAFGGPQTIGDLARTEQVRVPTMSRLVVALEADKLVSRVADETDRRIVRVKVTAKGKALMLEGRRRRVEVLSASIAGLTDAERNTLTRALPVIERLARGDR